MLRIFTLLIVLFAIAAAFACTDKPGTGSDSPTEAYTRLFAAVKSKDIEAIKKQITKKTIELGFTSAQKFGSAPEKMFENGFTATTFSETLPSIRDERIKENMGAVEVWNSKESKWEDLPFVIEDGTWKLAMGELFAGTFKTPAKGRDQIEKEAANAVGSEPVVLGTNGNSNMLANRLPAGHATNTKVK